MTTTELPPSACPYCGGKIEAHTGIGRAVEPKPGDVSICFGCAGVLVFDVELRPRLPTIAETARFDADERVQHARRALIDHKLGRR